MQTKKSSTSTHQPLRTASRWSLLLACLTLAACASLGGKPPEEQVRQRATERWQALIAGEFSRAYSYITPSYRAIVSPDGYRSRFGSAVVWVGSEVIDVKCPETNKCRVQLRLDVKPLMTRTNIDKITTHVDETWLLEDGQWWIFQDIKGL